MNFKDATALAAKLAKRGPVPYMDHLLLRPHADGLTLLAQGYSGTLEIDVAGIALKREVAVPARYLAKLAAYMPDATLRVDRLDLKMETEYAAMTVAGAKPELLAMVMPVLDPDETDEVPFSRKDFAWCSRYASPDDSRPVLTGVAINRETGSMCATDGFRIRVAGMADPDAQMERWLILPIAALPFTPDVDAVRASKGYAYFDTPGVRYWTQLIQGTFPDFRKLSPAEKDLFWRIDIDTLFLRPAVKGPLSLFGREGFRILRITQAAGANVGDRIAFTTRAEERGEATFKLPADYTGNPRIALNVNFFREVLAGCPTAERLTIQGISESSQILITTDDEHRREIIMPMFIQWD